MTDPAPERPRACLRVGAVGGAPIYLNVTLPIAFAVVGGLKVAPLAWAALAIIVVVHEAGHAILLRRYHLPVAHVLFHGLGGEVATGAWLSPWQRAVVAWGGVLGQLVLAGGMLLYATLFPIPPGSASHEFFADLAGLNLLLGACNLLPLRGLDGAEAWSIVRLGFLRFKHRYYAQRLSRLQRTPEADAAPPDSERERRRELH